MQGKRKKRIALLLASLMLCALGCLLLWPHSRVSEGIHRQAARIRKVEYIPNQSVDLEKTMACAQKDSLYALFRKNFRFHYQGIGTAVFPDSSRIILISEPTPFFRTDTLKSVFAKFNIQVEKRFHRMGYDGRITDLLIVMGNATTENVDHLVKRLSAILYFSDYKCPTFDLLAPEKRVYFTRSKLDYRISLGEINSWFLEEDEQFLKLSDTAHTYSVQELLDKRKYGVYFSRLPGFVAWVLPKHRDIAERRQDIRPFTLDADLILGAVSDSASLVILGREREAALNELPPLQVETVLLLASISDRELSQSLDINDLMAGKMGNGQDWCPTYLSRELENTEFGGLLTLTDILLKDWSESGTIHESHYAYPHPGYYPFPKPLFDLLGVSELVYNWNTADVMYAIDTDGKTIYSLNRTGALPVSYFLSQERTTSAGHQYEQKAYRYFAGCGNTDLARVVQYTALYQLFIDNDIQYAGELHNNFPKNKPYLLAKPCRRLLDQLRTLSPEKAEQIADSVTRCNFEGFHCKEINRQLAEVESRYGMQYTETEKEDIRQRILKDQKSSMVQQFAGIRQLLNSLSEEDYTRLARYLSYPRGTRRFDAAAYRTYQQAQRVRNLLHGMGKNHLALLGTELAEVRNSYCAQLSKASAPYVKTPSCVVTYHDFFTTGGHNLSSKISRVHSMNNYRREAAPVKDEVYAAPVSETENRPQETAPSSPTAPSAKRPAGPGNAKPAAVRPSGGKPSAPQAKSSAPAVKSTVSRPVPANGVRSRSSVISTQSRTQRGL